MLYTFRVDYRPDLKGADVLKVVDKVINAVQEHGITEEELKQAKVNFRSSFLENLESGSPDSAARTCSPRSRSTTTTRTASTRSSRDLDKVTTAEVQAGGEEISRAVQPHVDRSAPGSGGAK